MLIYSSDERSLSFLSKSKFTKFYKGYLDNYNTFEYQLRALNKGAEAIAGNYYGLLAIHSAKTKRLDIILGTQTVERSIDRKTAPLTTLFHKGHHVKPDMINSYMTLKTMYPKLGTVRCVSFKKYKLRWYLI